jgi:hypothetical protein
MTTDDVGIHEYDLGMRFEYRGEKVLPMDKQDEIIKRLRDLAREYDFKIDIYGFWKG